MSDRWEGRRGSDRGTLVFGGLLILVGLAFLGGEVYGIDWSNWGWPLFIIVPGVALLVLGFGVGGEGGLGAAIPGGIITTVGAILAVQNATSTYASWAYAWALVAPGSIGATMLLYGLFNRRGDLVDAGLRTAAVGLGLFVGFGLFFEDVVGLSEKNGSSAMRDALPILAIALGVLIVAVNLLPHRDRDRRWEEPATSNGASTPPPGSPPR